MGLTCAAAAKVAPIRYVESLQAAGADVVVLTPDAGPATIDDIAGLVLAGGDDVHPHHYGEALHPQVAETVKVDPPRDSLEMEIVRRALDRDLPVLGICRGVQVLNVALGGTLVQDLSLLGIDPAVHNQKGRLPAEEAAHDVRVAGHSRLRRILGETVVSVNSFHHQAVADPAPGLAVVAEAFDGVTEALEAPARSFVIGVQWHPERMVRAPEQAALFRAFVGAARRVAG